MKSCPSSVCRSKVVTTALNSKPVQSRPTAKAMALRHTGNPVTPGVTLTAYRQQLSVPHGSDSFSSDSSRRLSTGLSSSDAEFSSATASPAHHLPAALGVSSGPKRHSSLTTLFHKLNIRRTSTASSLEQSPRKSPTDLESSDEDSMFSKLKRKSKSVGNVRRKKKQGLRRHDGHPDLHSQLQADSPSGLQPSMRSHSVDGLAEPVCPNCRLHSLATDSGVGSMSLTAPSDSPLWLGWHSSEKGTDSSSGFLAQAHLSHSNPNLADSPDLCIHADSDMQQCRECGSLFRDVHYGSPNVRVEFEQDYVC